MEKIVGASRKQTTEQLADIVSDINRTALEFDQSVIDRARSILQPIHVSDEETTSPGNSQSENFNLNVELHNDVSTSEGALNPSQNDVMITGSRNGKYEQNCASNIPSIIPSISISQMEVITNDIEVKNEEADQQVMSSSKSKKFTAEEDRYLKLGIEKYCKGAWSLILRDKKIKFHPKRNRDSLRMRAKTLRITKKSNKTEDC